MSSFTIHRNFGVQDRRLLGFALPVLAALTLAPPVAAEEFDPFWQLALDLALVNPSGDQVTVGIGGSGVNVDFDAKAGAGLRGEYRFAESLAFELGVLGASGFDVNIGDTGNNFGVATRVSSMSVLSSGVNYHFTPKQRVDVYAGLFLAMINYGDLDTEVGTGGVSTTVAVDADFSWGAIAGLNILLGKGHWFLQSNIRYIDTEMTGTSEDGKFGSDFDPIVFSIGFGYRF